MLGMNGALRGTDRGADAADTDASTSDCGAAEDDNAGDATSSLSTWRTIEGRISGGCSCAFIGASDGSGDGKSLFIMSGTASDPFKRSESRASPSRSARSSRILSRSAIFACVGICRKGSPDRLRLGSLTLILPLKFYDVLIHDTITIDVGDVVSGKPSPLKTSRFNACVAQVALTLRHLALLG